MVLNADSPGTYVESTDRKRYLLLVNDGNKRAGLRRLTAEETETLHALTPRRTWGESVLIAEPEPVKLIRA